MFVCCCPCFASSFLFLAFGRNGACLFVYQTVFLFTRWSFSQPPIDWITTSRSLPAPPPLRPWQQQHRFRSLAPRCTAFCFPPGRRKESGARAQRCGRTSISDPRGGALCYVVPPAWLTRRGATDSVAATILSPLPWSLQNWRAYLCALLALSEGEGEEEGIDSAGAFLERISINQRTPIASRFDLSSPKGR